METRHAKLARWVTLYAGLWSGVHFKVLELYALWRKMVLYCYECGLNNVESLEDLKTFYWFSISFFSSKAVNFTPTRVSDPEILL